MIEISNFNITNLEKAWNLWNEEAQSNIYSALSLDEFKEKYFFNRSDIEVFAYQALSSGELIGFAFGDIKKEYLQGENYDNTPGYISYIFVKNEFRNKGVGFKLLSALIDNFRSLSKKKVLISYRNPLMLEWHIPGKHDTVHNNAPGVPVDGLGYDFFIKNGFTTLRIEDGLFVSLDEFILSPSFYEKKSKLEQMGIDITMYDSKIHYGFDALFDALKGEVWRKTINDNNNKEHPLPVLIASDNGKIVGFAGPIDKEKNGRGWFNGIATHPDYERNGIALVLFCSLMNEFKKIGASFSTIFTDEDNPALILYKKVGFSVGCRFALMEKEI